MTRITNFGVKRTYAQTGFQIQGNETTSNSREPDDVDVSRVDTKSTAESTVEPQKKKKRLRKSKLKKSDSSAQSLGSSESGLPSTSDSGAAKEGLATKEGGGKQKEGVKKIKDRKKRMISATEARRLKRMNERLSQTTCFACRAQGHAAKDCPKAVKSFNGEDGQIKTAAVVGICYRCGSKKHSLSRCKKPNNPTNPYPFASCFVCDGKGHLASACPQNKDKGIYPNGGCCKLCGETTHLARDCSMRQKANDPTVVIGTAREAGADEDDFHAFKRTTAELDLTEKREDKTRRMLEIKKGALSGTVVKLGNIPLPGTKKVVVFK